MTSDNTTASNQSAAVPPSVPAAPVVADKRLHSTRVVLGAGILGGLFGAAFTAGAAFLIMAFGFGPPPPPGPGFGPPGASHFGFPPPGGPGGPMAGPKGPLGMPPPMGPGGPGMRSPFRGGPPPLGPGGLGGPGGQQPPGPGQVPTPPSAGPSASPTAPR